MDIKKCFHATGASGRSKKSTARFDHTPLLAQALCVLQDELKVGDFVQKANMLINRRNSSNRTKILKYAIILSQFVTNEMLFLWNEFARVFRMTFLILVSNYSQSVCIKKWRTKCSFDSNERK